jgi:rubrerythrin
MSHISQEEKSMTENRPIEIMKGALLLERRGQAFYEGIAQKTESAAVRKIFEMMAQEEAKHVEALTRQYTYFEREGRLAETHYDARPEPISNQILNEKIRSEISAAGYEAAAIAAAIGLEDQAVKYYTREASRATDPVEKELYTWLSNWEKLHLKLLVEIDDELKENVWYDNNFWPVI